MNTAQKVREHKATWPDMYCTHPGCLWRVKHRCRPDTPCRKHAPRVTPEQCRDCGAPFNDANPSPSGLCRACEG